MNTAKIKLNKFLGKFKNPPPIQDDNKIKVEMSRLTKKGFKMSLEFVQDIKKDDDFQIVVFNIQSLKRKLNFLKNDEFYSNAEMICLSEARIDDKTDYNLDNYEIVNKIKSFKNQNMGSITYIKRKYSHLISHINTNIDFKEKNYFIIETFILDFSSLIVLLSVYKSPNYPNGIFLQTINSIISDLKQKNYVFFIVIGDFNINIMNTSEINQFDIKSLKEFMRKNILNFCLSEDQPSTDNNTQIDHCYSNINKLQCNYYESFPVISYHKPIWVLLNTKKTITLIDDKMNEKQLNKQDLIKQTTTKSTLAQDNLKIIK